jgi:hypothetical protein
MRLSDRLKREMPFGPLQGDPTDFSKLLYGLHAVLSPATVLHSSRRTILAFSLRSVPNNFREIAKAGVLFVMLTFKW